MRKSRLLGAGYLCLRILPITAFADSVSIAWQVVTH
jgi:hypothetical protein